MGYLVVDPPYHVNGSVTSSGATITPSGHGKYINRIIFQNIGGDMGGENLMVSFDSGVNYFTVSGSLDISARVTSFMLKSDNTSSQTKYEILYTVASLSFGS